jgi:hypothetical protein
MANNRPGLQKGGNPPGQQVSMLCGEPSSNANFTACIPLQVLRSMTTISSTNGSRRVPMSWPLPLGPSTVYRVASARRDEALTRLITDSSLSINRGLGKLDILDKRPLPDPGTSHGTDVSLMQSHDGCGEQEDDRGNGLVSLKVCELRLDLATCRCRRFPQSSLRHSCSTSAE